MMNTVISILGIDWLVGTWTYTCICYYVSI